MSGRRPWPEATPVREVAPAAPEPGLLLRVHGLCLEIVAGDRRTAILRDVSLELGEGEALALVGESGAGKSMTARAIARLLPDTARCSGSVVFDGIELLSLEGAPLRAARARMSVVFQDPRAHVNPVRRIGDFMTEQLRTLGLAERRDAALQAEQMLDAVGIDDARRRMRQYPHELSGGMLQRVMIAAALLNRPRLILADEPTTGLDVTTQSEVMAIMDELRRDLGIALLFITHDLDLAAAVCDRTTVMYAGEIVESQASDRLHEQPRHPYTAALSLARPDINVAAPRLQAILGHPVGAAEAPPNGCAFASRCRHAQPRCTESHPPLVADESGAVRCVRADELRPQLAAAR